MAAHPYSLRSRINGQSPSLRTPTGSPVTRSTVRSPRKTNASNVSLQLLQVIGTTTNSPPGLASCTVNDSYAYCAGSVAVLAAIQSDRSTSKRYFKARPTALALNPSTSYYDTASPAATPTRRRTSIFARRKTQDVDVGSSRDWQEEGSHQTWTARERIKTTTCVALSENGRWLAVGESGYSPRVLLYSTVDETLSDTPVSIVSDHGFGLKCVAFSLDSRYLATLGSLNDGFLFIWAVQPKTGSLTLQATNKCTSNICAMTWCGQSLVTVGTRHVKIWSIGQNTKPTPSKRFRLRGSSEEIASPGPAILTGHNALLGSLVDSTFTSIVAVDQQTVFLGADSGQLCAVELADGSPELKILKTFDFGITSIAWQFSNGRLVVGGRHGICHEDYATLIDVLRNKTTSSQSRPESPRKAPRSSIRQSLGLLHTEAVGVAALACINKHTITLDSEGNLHLTIALTEENQSELSFSCHNDVIQGVQGLPEQSDLGAFYTWSKRGEVRFWDTEGTLLSTKITTLDQQDMSDDTYHNELRVLRFISSLNLFVGGDRYGILTLVESQNWNQIWLGRAHGAEISDVAVHEDTSLLATCGRDRMVQLFKATPTGLNLIQTLDDHIGAVTQVLFTTDADKLLSCSADRTIVIRDKAMREASGASTTAYLSSRIITLRSTPLSMTFLDGSCAVLLTSTSDRHVVKAEVSTGAIIETIKVTDPENDDTVALSSICASSKSGSTDEQGSFLTAYSSTDKSIRVYDADKCQLLTREAGHTEGISDLCLIERRLVDVDRIQRTLVSTGLDGTIMIWNIAASSPILVTPGQELSQLETLQSWESEGTPVKASPASLPPLRKVLSKMDAVEFTRCSGAASPSSPRSLSPPRLVRKRSQLALTTTIDEKDEDKENNHQVTKDDEPNAILEDTARSPSPEPVPMGKLKKQRSRADVSSEAKGAAARRSPSPPRNVTMSTPTTPRSKTVANNSRLRRPPSVPTDLRGQAQAQSRRQSMSQASDFGSMGMATEQACRMLKTYRRKLTSSRENLDLDELEEELELITKLVRERKGKRVQTPNGRRLKAKAATESDIDALADLLDKTGVVDRARSVEASS